MRYIQDMLKTTVGLEPEFEGAEEDVPDEFASPTREEEIEGLLQTDVMSNGQPYTEKNPFEVTRDALLDALIAQQDANTRYRNKTVEDNEAQREKTEDLRNPVTGPGADNAFGDEEY